MKKIYNIIKLIILNIIILVFLLGLFTTLPILFYKSFDLFHTLKNYGINYERKITEVRDGRSSLINYDKHEWAFDHFHEVSNLKTKYKDFVVWRRLPYSGKTINIDKNGFRHTKDYSEASSKNNILFFGGSTMWGTGSNDENTIPSLYSKEYKLRTYNFGESGYTSRQSLALLINLYLEGKIKPDKNIIIFYDGFNDVFMGCRSEIDKIQTQREKQINEILEINTDNDDFWPISDLRFIFLPTITLIEKIKDRGRKNNSESNYYNCDTDKKKAKFVANSLIKNWTIASELAKLNGDKFIGILQPSTFISNPDLKNLKNTKYFKPDKNIKKQFDEVYKEIFMLLDNNKDIKFLDLTKIFDQRENIYIDEVHVSPNGNQIIVEKIGNLK